MNTSPKPYAISIDPPGAQEIDDAISCFKVDEGWVVHVCIPDVPLLLVKDSDEDGKARGRGMTTYKANSVRESMLPVELVKKLSLSPNEDRPMIHVRLTVANDLTVQNVEIERIRHRTTAKLSYAQADDVLNSKTHSLHFMLATLWDLALRLQQERGASAGAIFDLSKNIMTNEEGTVVEIDQDRAHKSNLIVMEMMILANSALASHANANDKKILYRNHRLKGMKRGDRNSIAAEIAMKERVGHAVARQKIKTMGYLVEPADLSPISLGHYGLDRKDYAWFTSPLRRYIDVINLRALVCDITEEDAEATAVRFTGLYQDKKNQSDEHHGRMHRRRIIDLIISGTNTAKTDEYNVHTIIRALRENTGYDQEKIESYLKDRLMRDSDISGRDIHELLEASENLFTPTVIDFINKWADTSARQLLLKQHKDKSNQQTDMQDSEKVFYKAQLFDIASRLKAKVFFDQAIRTGPPHSGIFTTKVTWIHNGKTEYASAEGNTIKAAEHEAARIMLEIVTPPKDDTERRSPPVILEGANPKSVLMEMMAKSRSLKIAYGSPAVSGPPHAPTFTVKVFADLDGNQIKRQGTGSTKKEAERQASLSLLRALENMQ